MGLVKMSTFLHTRLAAETHLADGEFTQVTENKDDDDDKDNNNNNNTQGEWIREANDAQL
jgi:hypothetical protein